VSIQLLPADGRSFDDIKAACEERIRQYFSTLKIGGPLVRAAMTNAVFSTGLVKNYQLISPSDEVRPAADVIIVPGNMTIANLPVQI